MQWGRLSYNPDLPNSLFEQHIAQRFPEVSSGEMFQAWQQASMIFPQLTRYFWGDIDVRWFPEACMSHPRWRGFYTVKDFIEKFTMPGSGVLDIMQWREKKLANQPMDGQTPIEVADNLAKYAARTLELVADLKLKVGDNKELRLTLGDLEAMAYLGQYYSEKIHGAADLALFDKTGDVEQRAAAIAHLRRALSRWIAYSSAYTKQYKQPVLYNRVGWIDIPGLKARVEQDILIAQLWRPGTADEIEAKKRYGDSPFKK
jgi:hypothetical protein